MSEFLIGWIVLLPLVLGALAWGARSAGPRRAVVVAAAAAIALLGLWLAWRGPFTASFGRPAALAGHLLEFALTAAVFEISRRRRVWSAMLLSAAQLGLVAYQHVWLGALRRRESCVFAVDALSLIMVLIISIIGSLIAIFAIGYMNKHEEHAPKTARLHGPVLLLRGRLPRCHERAGAGGRPQVALDLLGADHAVLLLPDRP